MTGKSKAANAGRTAEKGGTPRRPQEIKPPSTVLCKQRNNPSETPTQHHAYHDDRKLPAQINI